MAVTAGTGQHNATRPPLKWAGGKRWLIPHLAEFWTTNRHRRLVEPLCGGLAVSLGLRPERALLNDINPHSINFYRWLQRGLNIDSTIEFANRAELYYRHRERFNELIAAGHAASVEAAALFYYLNRTCYNGLCRFNGDGFFNVPFGRYSQINYERDFSSYRRVFGKWTFSFGDFAQIEVGPDDFIYADPPYDVEFTKYAKEAFTWNDQVRLAEWLARLTVPAILSNQATHRIVRLYRDLGFQLRFFKAPRMINCTGDRTPAREVLAIKNL
jgi:DNA adenine methylase